MAVRALRGATTVENNDSEEILEATREMISAVIEANELKSEDIIDMIFTVTPDLDKVFPARAARQIGFTEVALLDMLAPDIEGALKKCIRVVIHINTDKSNSEMKPQYLRGAKVLRPDIVNKEGKSE